MARTNTNAQNSADHGKTATVSTLAGSGHYGFADGIGSAAQFDEPFGIAIDKVGNIYVADRGSHRISKIAIK